MGIVWLVSLVSAGLCAVTVFAHRKTLAGAPLSWQLLAWSGIPLSLGGLVFVLRFWKPTAGPYLANHVYPLGPYLNTWQVSFGFAWLALGVAFFVLAVQGDRSWRTWWALVVTWILVWLPHGIIGIGFAAAGTNQPSVRLYQDWASHFVGVAVLLVDSGALLAHFGLALIGFGLTARDLWRASS